jgi:hypothetical protein
MSLLSLLAPVDTAVSPNPLEARNEKEAKDLEKCPLWLTVKAVNRGSFVKTSYASYAKTGVFWPPNRTTKGKNKTTRIAISPFALIILSHFRFRLLAAGRKKPEVVTNDF